jgi:uncharacterized protein YigE (DUF2233 family)
LYTHSQDATTSEDIVDTKQITMNRKRFLLTIYILLLVGSGLIAFKTKVKSYDNEILTYTVDVKNQDLKLYWKDDNGNIFKSIQNLKNHLTNKQLNLLFAVNGGMYKKDNSPQGLFIQEYKQLSPLDTSVGNGNFYLKPNGVFYITTNNRPIICETAKFIDNGQIKYATQSGPMLIIDGQIHSAFKQGSRNLNIRNGVGILPDNRIVFAMSKKEINFYDFANYFKTLGCNQALYLDGFVSRTYLPEKKWIQTDGNFGVIIGITEPKK